METLKPGMFRIWRHCPWDVAFAILTKSMTMDQRIAWGVGPGRLRVPAQLAHRLTALCEKHSAAYRLSINKPAVEINLQGPKIKHVIYVIMLAFRRFPVTIWHWGDVLAPSNPPRLIFDIHTAEEFTDFGNF